MKNGTIGQYIFYREHMCVEGVQNKTILLSDHNREAIAQSIFYTGNTID
jgi:hypothetical protein